ncbi:MAG: tetratricopeptide repeat protein, partial [Sphingomonadaceae bacterium]|nr:tetratricopeptide repeat protein [Sphingomonadaceae bacterium]
MKPTLLKFAASTMVIGASLVAVAPVANSSDVAEADSREAQAAARYAEQAREALNDSRPDRAVRFAERAVERMPRSAEYRHLLGRAYLAAGRFASAETSFQDALTINPDLDRTAFNLALSQIAQGDTADALAELRELEGRLNASDLGLAYALAGNRERAVEILRDAARANGGDPRARQNLALAYAMDGRWAEARITAAQDVSLAVLDQRMRDWAQFAQSANSWDQVSSLLGVQADGSDPGQPVRLALAPIQGEIMVADASVEDAPVQASAGAMVAFTAPVEESFEVSSAPRESSITEIEVPPAAEPDEAPIDMSASLASDPIEPARAAPAPVAPRVAGDYADVATGEFIVEDEVQFEETPVEVAAIDVAPPAAPVAPVA